jgi:hypothetical protein
METRTALVPDGWEDPRELAVLGMAEQDEAAW